MVFNLIVNLLEATFFSVFVAYYSAVPNRKKFIIQVTFMQFLLLSIFQSINYNGFILTITVIFVVITSIYFAKRKLLFNDLFTTVLYNGIILVCAITSSLFLLYIESFWGITWDGNMRYIILCSISKTLQIVSTILILKKCKLISFTMDLYNWRVIILYELCIIIGISILGYSIITNYVSDISNYALLLILIILGIYFKAIVKKIEKINKEKIALMQEKQIAEFNKQKYNAISSVKMEMEAIDHRLFYTIFKIEELLKKAQYDDILDIIEDYKNNILKYKVSVNTGNDIFDTLYSMKINDLILNGIDVNSSVFISQNEFYNKLEFINVICDILNYYKNCNMIRIQIKEVNNFIIVNIFHRNCELDIHELFDYLIELSSICKFKFNLESYLTKGLRLIFQLDGDSND